MEDDIMLAHTIRGGKLDCIHYGSVVVVNRHGEVLFSAGNMQKFVFDRSLPKPYKAVGVVDCGAADKFHFESAELAIMAGSHSGSRMHVEKLKDMLSKLRLPISSLKCGAELPVGTDAIQELIEDGESHLNALQCDCSGEHIGNLSVCQLFGWPIENYEHPNHPVQRYLRKIVDTFIEFSTNTFTIDGCNFPTYYVPLFNLAKGMANLCDPTMYIESAKRVVNSIIQEPSFFAGSFGRYDTNLIRASEGSIISKCGAEGLYAVGWPGKGIGLAIKVADGNHRAAPPVIVNIADRLGLASKELISTIRQSTAENICTNTGLKVGYIESLI